MLAKDCPPVPLVSVLIRTIGRETLLPAVNSVLSQSLPDWELLILNASGQSQTIQERLPADPRLHWVDSNTPLPRSQAANQLLQRAQGIYFIFLDDDDWLLPDHLKKLVDTLRANPSLVAAYSDVQIMGGERDAMVAGHTFAADYDPLRLQLENYLPIHAVMFRRDVAMQPPACTFDPDLQLFEDWDFWLQLAQRGDFSRVPGISAIYAMDEQAGSGHAHSASQLRHDMLKQLASRQLQRWQPSQVAALMQLMGKQRSQIHQLLQEAESSQQQLQAITQQLQAVTQEHNRLAHIRVQHLDQIQHLNQQLSDVYQSTSWRITRPMRIGVRLIRWVVRGGLFRVMRHVLQAVALEVRRNGWRGFIGRIPHYLRRASYYLPLLAARPPSVVNADFHAAPALPRELRLHPDLGAEPETLDVKVSVVIPTLNAGTEFYWLLRKLQAQKGVKEVEVVVVDSGSRDETVAYARQLGCKVVQILPSEFSHSYARNRGADEASGDYLLFMVQDAYPIGDHWLYGMVRYLLDHQQERVMAASCAEYSRSDSDMMYDAMVNTHYRFLGCLDFDRVGEHRGNDHMSLRSQGQLSDVSCLIPRPFFMQYRYRGDYAEDLDLGMRLIKDGYRVAMLASVKVIHSHNRPAYYYLKRTFVDVVFLVGLFDDFTYPPCHSAQGLVAGIVSTAAHITTWLNQLASQTSPRSLGDEITHWIQSTRAQRQNLLLTAPIALGEDRLNTFIQQLAQRCLGHMPVALDGTARQEAQSFIDTFVARLDHFNQFAQAVYGPQDATLRQELGDVVRKTFAAAMGGALGFFYLDRVDAAHPEHDLAMSLHTELKAGV
jgi:O-antigen biosynthesis protein